MRHEAASGAAGGRQPRGRARRIRLPLAAVVMVALFAAASGRLFVWPATDPPERADAVVVFAGKRERLAEGIRVVRAGMAPVLVISDGGRPRSRAARTCRNPPADLRVVCVTPERSSTAAEAAAFAGLADRQGWRSLVLVTSTYHVRRAGLLLDRCFAGEVATVAAPRRGGVGLVADVLHEWAGLAAAVTVQRTC
jgi:uncharacterized SAM-binding protein YcdF (DUF218 family)